MSLLNMILGNVSEIDAESLERDFAPLLCDGEKIERAYKLIRDKWVFTNKRLILQNIQGVTGKKVEYHSIPYRSIVHYSIESAGTFDMDAELKIWVRGLDAPIVQNFGRDSNLRELQQVLANYVL